MYDTQIKYCRISYGKHSAHTYLKWTTSMNKIIENYYLEPNSKLVYHELRMMHVDCWFDTDEIRQHRCLSYEDFNKIKATS